MCRDVETGTFVFAVMNAVFWALSIVGIVIGLIVNNILAPSNIVEKFVYEERYQTVKYVNVGLSIAFVICVIHFIFAVLLCNGISNRKVSQIKAYFVYGIVHVVISIIANIIGIAIISPMAIFLIPIGIYCVFLHTVNLTMKKFKSGAIIAHRPLVEIGINHMQ